MKLADDCDDIDLDITLAKFEIARRFLLQVLNQIIKEVDIKDHDVILADGGVVRLVLASGGVARDFLSIFRKAVDVARERGRTHRGERVNAEDVNVAAGEHEPSKRDELRRDTLEERQVLERALRNIRDFCVTNKVNCFLVEQDAAISGRLDVLGELADLRFVHVVNSRTTVRDRPGKLFTAYMLDISQYTGERRRRDLAMISFWERSELDKIRRSKYILPMKMKTRRQMDSCALRKRRRRDCNCAALRPAVTAIVQVLPRAKNGDLKVGTAFGRCRHSTHASADRPHAARRGS